MFKFPDSIEDLCIACVPVGSRVTCDPAPTDTDQDILCLVDPDEEEGFFSWIEKHNWEFEGDEKYDMDNFTSYRKAHFNLIITTKPQWFDAFLDATRECKEKNLLKKSERIEVFEKYIPQNKKKAAYDPEGKLKAIMAQIAAGQTAVNNPQPYMIQNQAGHSYSTGSPVWITQPSLWGSVVGESDPLGGFSESY